MDVTIDSNCEDILSTLENLKQFGSGCLIDELIVDLTVMTLVQVNLLNHIIQNKKINLVNIWVGFQNEHEDEQKNILVDIKLESFFQARVEHHNCCVPFPRIEIGGTVLRRGLMALHTYFQHYPTLEKLTIMGPQSQNFPFSPLKSLKYLSLCDTGIELIPSLRPFLGNSTTNSGCSSIEITPSRPSDLPPILQILSQNQICTELYLNLHAGMGSPESISNLGSMSNIESLKLLIQGYSPVKGPHMMQQLSNALQKLDKLSKFSMETDYICAEGLRILSSSPSPSSPAFLSRIKNLYIGLVGELDTVTIEAPQQCFRELLSQCTSIESLTLDSNFFQHKPAEVEACITCLRDIAPPTLMKFKWNADLKAKQTANLVDIVRNCKNLTRVQVRSVQPGHSMTAAKLDYYCQLNRIHKSGLLTTNDLRIFPTILNLSSNHLSLARYLLQERGDVLIQSARRGTKKRKKRS